MSAAQRVAIVGGCGHVGLPLGLAFADAGLDVTLFDIDDAQRMSREEAAARLRALADALAKNNSVEFQRDGRLITVRVPDEVDLKVEVELGDEGDNELEVELTW